MGEALGSIPGPKKKRQKIKKEDTRMAKTSPCKDIHHHQIQIKINELPLYTL
jgi:hypothetical protein